MHDGPSRPLSGRDEQPHVPAPPAGNARVDAGDRRRFARVVNLLCPGLGQLLTGRWRTGLVFLGLFLAAAGTAMGVSLTLILRIYTTAASAMRDSTVELQGTTANEVAWVLGALGVAVTVLVASLWDADRP